MELDRPHFRTTSTTSTSELFICFSSRLSSSSSMKLTKSILSPGRAARDGGPVSLSSSLSRRLRTNGSLKGGASPFFTTAKKRGCGYENPEPSSPKVTCIGQVRVKTKKKVRQTRNLSRRRSGDVSFKKIEQGRADLGHNNEEKMQGRYSSAANSHSHYKSQNQRWAHLPISICEALKAFGAEFSCLFPCKSPCFSSERAKSEEKQNGNENGCGAAFTRWLVSVNDGESGNRREIELVVGGGDEVEEERRVSMRRSSRRHVFEDIEVKDDRIEVKGQSCNLDEEEEEEKGRVSVCIPPKNALLLMRCRSDPMKVAALASRFSWDANAAGAEHENGDLEEDAKNFDENEEFETESGGKNEILLKGGEESGYFVSVESSEKIHVAVEAENIEEELVIRAGEMLEEELQREIGECNEEMFVGEEEEEEEEEEVESNMSSFEALLDQENADQHYEDCPIQENEQVSESEEDDIESREFHLLSEEEEAPPVTHMVKDATIDDENQLKTEQEETNQEYEEIRANKSFENNELGIPDEELENEKESQPVLPDCLLLMMREPKLSMEVSKETWVCSTDFIRWLPERPPKAKDGNAGGGCGGCHHKPVKKRLSTDSKPTQLEKIVSDQPPPVQPRRSSCSLPPKAPSMATVIEQKLVNAVAYEPFVLTRCKSEPMRTAAAKLMPDSFLWKNAMRKLEPHRRATFGAAGVGF